MSSSDYGLSDDSDVELQNAFQAGLIKPGLNVPVLEQKKKVFVNDVKSLNQKLLEMQNNLKWCEEFNEKGAKIKTKRKTWFERLDLVCKPAPLAPEMAMQIDDQETQHLTNKNTALNEFKRETNFHRQAQAAVLEGLARLKELGVSTKRPEDYFAEMAKTDTHMQMVRNMLVKKQAETEQTERIRKIRQQKKISKQLQKEGKVKKQTDKKEMLDEVKKFRKGIRKDLDFLEPKKSQKNVQNKSKNGLTRSQIKKKHKDSKFGFGGKKRGLKANTRESSANVDDYKSSFNTNSKKMKPGKKNSKAFRPGKNKRVQNKARRKS